MNIVKFYIDSFSGLSKDIWKLSLIYLVNRSGEMVIPFMSLYITSQLGYTKTEAASILLAYGIGALFGSNIGGYFADKVGNFKVMAFSLFSTAIAFPGIVFFTSFWPLCIWIFLTAICASSFSPGAFGAVGTYGKPENATRGYSLLRMAINLGVAIGPFFGGLLATFVGYKWLFIVDGITCFLAGLVLLKVLGHRNTKPVIKKEENKNFSSPYLDPYLILFLLFNLINMVAFFQILFSVPVYFREVVQLNEFWIGIFFMANGLMVFAFEMPLVFIIEKSGKFFKPMIWGALTIGLAYLSFYVFDNLIVGILFYSVLLAFGEIINFPLIPGLAMKRSNENNQGKVMGLVSMMFASAYTLAPISGLPIIEKIGYEKYWLLAAGMSVISAFCLFLLKDKYNANLKENELATEIKH